MLSDDSSEFLLLPPGAQLPCCDGRLADLYRYWLSIRLAPDLLPGRQHFDPIAIPQLLKWIWMAEIFRNPLRFKYRLVGTVHVDIFGEDTTGRWYDDVHPGFHKSTAYPQFVAVAERGMAAFYRGSPSYVVDAKWKLIERLMLPLAQNGRDVDKVLGITVLDPRPLGIGAERGFIGS